MSDPDITPIIARANLPERVADQLIKRRAELEPVVSTQVDSLLIMADHDLDLAIGLSMMQLELLIAIKAKAHLDAPTQG